MCVAGWLLCIDICLFGIGHGLPVANGNRKGMNDWREKSFTVIFTEADIERVMKRFITDHAVNVHPDLMDETGGRWRFNEKGELVKIEEHGTDNVIL